MNRSDCLPGNPEARGHASPVHYRRTVLRYAVSTSSTATQDERVKASAAAKGSQSLPRGPAACPGPLEIIAAEPAGDVDRFADRIEAGHGPRRHGLRGEAGGGDAARGHLGLGIAFAAARPEAPVGEPPLGAAQGA